MYSGISGLLPEFGLIGVSGICATIQAMFDVRRIVSPAQKIELSAGSTPQRYVSALEHFVPTGFAQNIPPTAVGGICALCAKPHQLKPWRRRERSVTLRK